MVLLLLVALVRRSDIVAVVVTPVLSGAFLHAVLAELLGQAERGGASGGGDGRGGSHFLLEHEHVLLSFRAFAATAGAATAAVPAVFLPAIRRARRG